MREYFHPTSTPSRNLASTQVGGLRSQQAGVQAAHVAADRRLHGCLRTRHHDARFAEVQPLSRELLQASPRRARHDPGGLGGAGGAAEVRAHVSLQHGRHRRRRQGHYHKTYSRVELRRRRRREGRRYIVRRRRRARLHAERDRLQHHSVPRRRPVGGLRAPVATHALRPRRVI